jgi:hypothetical protein
LGALESDGIYSLRLVPSLKQSSAIEEEILESVPKTMKTKAEILVRKMKADPNIAWSEKGELKYKGETVRGSE